MRLWRISKHRGLDGVGGTLASGRWHAMPRCVVYASEHPALSMVELMAQMQLPLRQVPRTLRLIGIDVPQGIKAADTELAEGWQANEPMTQSIGNAWLDQVDSLLLKVPSSVLPQAFNYLLNPAHADAVRVTEQDFGPFWFDARFAR